MDETVRAGNCTDKTLQAEIKTYFDMAGFTSTADKKNPTAEKFEGLLLKSIPFMQSVGVELDGIPNEYQLEQLNDYLLTVPNRMGKTYSPSTISDWKRHTENFFIYRHKPKGDTSMNDYDNEHASAELAPDTVRAGLAPDTVTPENDTARKPGRPIKGKEERDKKITVNIPSALFNDIKDLAHIDNVTIPDIINAIFEHAAQDRASDIEAIRNLRAKRR